MLAEHGLNVTRSFCYWPDFVPEPERSTRRCWSGSPTSSTRTSRPGSARSRPSSSVTCPARTGIRPGERAATSTATSGSWRSRRGSPRRSPALRPPPGGRRLARLERDAALRRAGDERGDHRVGAARRAGRAGGGRDPADLARRRRLGRRGLRRPTTATRCATLAPLVDFVGPHVYPMQDDEVRQLLTRGVRLRARRAASASRSCSRSSASRSDFARRRARRRLLPAGPAHDAARRRPRLDRLEQLRLRRPPRRGSVPPPRLRDALRPDRSARAGRSRSCTSWREFAELVASARRRGWEPVAGEAALVVPEHFERVLPVHDPGLPAGHPRQPAPGVHRGARGGSAGRARARARRPRRRRAAVPRPVREAADGARASTACGSSPPTARPSTSPTSPAARRTSAARGSRGSRRSSAFGIACATASSTRSSRTRSCSSSSGASARSRPAPADVPRRRRGERPRVPARRAGRGRGRRRRRARPPGAPAPRARERSDHPLHLSARAHGGPHAAGEPGGHLAALLGARRGGRGRRGR